MATFNQTVEILFTAVDETGTGIQNIGQSLQDVSAPIADVTKKFLLFEAAIVAVGTALATKAFNEAVKFESALLDLQKVLGESEGNAADFTGEVDRLSLKFGESANEILQGAAQIKQAGFTVEEAFRLQEDALTASVISELDVIEATGLLIRSLKGFKAPAEDANRILDLFNEVSNKNATNVRELATGFSEFAPIAQKLGLSFEETNALLVPIIETFGSGTEAGNALKIALTSLIVPTGPAADELERLGIATRDSSGQLRKGRDITFELIEAMSKLDSTQQIATLAIIAGERQSGRLSETFGNLAKVNKVLEDQTTASGSAQRELAIRLKASETQINITTQAFNILARTIGEKFRVELTSVIGGIGALEKAFKELVDQGALDQFFAAIEPQLANLNKAFIDIAKALPEAFKDVDFTPITQALEEIFEGAGSLFDDLDLSRPEDLAKVLNRLIEIGGSFIQTTEGIISVFGTVGGAIISLVEFYGSLDKDTQQLIGTVGGLSVVFTALSPAIISIGAAISALGGAGAIGALIVSFAGPVGLAAAAITAGLALKGAREEAEQAEARLAKLPAVIETSTAAFKRLGFDTIESFKNALKAGDVFFDKVAGNYELATDKITESNEDVKDSVSSIADTFDDTGKRIIDSSKEVGFAIESNNDIAKALGDEWIVVGDNVVKVGDQSQLAMGAAAKASGDLFLVMEDGSVVTGQAAGAFNDFNDVTKETIKRDAEAEKSLTARVETLAKFKISLEAIQSAERVSIFEFKTELDLAEIEAGAQKFQDLTDTIQTGLTTTAGTIVELFQLLASGTAGQALFIKDAIERQLDLQERQVALQEKLTLAQILELESRRSARDRGDAQIIVRAEGLEPHLQEVLRALIEFAQVEGIANGDDFLLNL